MTGIAGERVKLTSENVSGSIESSNVILLDQAIEFYNEEILATPANAEAYSQRGLVWLLVHEREKAIRRLHGIAQLDPKLAYVYRNRGNVFHEQGKNDKAIADYDEAIALYRNGGKRTVKGALHGTRVARIRRRSTTSRKRSD